MKLSVDCIITFQPCWNYKFYAKELNIVNKKILESLFILLSSYPSLKGSFKTCLF